MAVKVVVYSSKGGVGKTTLTWALSSFAAWVGVRTLVIDCDMQGHVAWTFGVKAGDNATRLLLGESWSDVIVEARPNLDLVPADFSLAEVWGDVEPDFFRKRLAEVDSQYGLVFFDTNPGWFAVNIAAARAADYILAPVQLSFLALAGAVTLSRLLQFEEPSLMPKLLGVVPNMHDLRGRRTLEVLDALKQQFRDRIAPPIRTSVDIDRAQNLGKTIMEYAPGSHAAWDLEEVGRWFVDAVKAKAAS